MNDEIRTGEILDEAVGRESRRRSRWESVSDACDPTDCLTEACCASLFDGACLTSLTALLGAGGGLFAAVAGAGRVGRQLRREARAPHGPLAAALYRGVRYYQLSISARRPGYGGCRHTPTCSAYAVESLRRHGALKGMRLAARRLRRCRPGAVGGADPVP